MKTPDHIASLIYILRRPRVKGKLVPYNFRIVSDLFHSGLIDSVEEPDPRRNEWYEDALKEARMYVTDKGLQYIEMLLEVPEPVIKETTYYVWVDPSEL